MCGDWFWIRLSSGTSRTSLSPKLGSPVNGRPNLDIRSTPADVAAHRFINVGVGGSRLSLEERCRGHDLAGLAVTTLWDVNVDPGALNGMAVVWRQSFDRRDGLACNR